MHSGTADPKGELCYTHKLFMSDGLHLSVLLFATLNVSFMILGLVRNGGQYSAAQ